MPNAMVGRPAPDFDLATTTAPGPGPVPRRARLRDYRGRWLVVVFYPRDFSLVCPTELTALGDRVDEFRGLGADVLGVSTDSVVSHERWVSLPKSRGGLGGLGFPLASDPDGSVSTSYGVFLDEEHVALRGLFIVDPEGVLQYQVVHNPGVGRSTEEVFRVLAAIQTGGLCAEGWSPEAPASIDPTEVLGPGRVIAHYRVDSVIGTGTFSTVYRAHDLTLDRDVALKVFKPGPAGRSKAALAEARAAASLGHPNVCTVFAVDDAQGASMIAMEYLRGPTLAEIIANGPMPADCVAQVVAQVASGMAAAHERGLVHGDLKPANVVIGEDGVAKVLDFGLSRRERPAVPAFDLDATADADADADEAEPSGLSGTPSYMAPELIQGETPSSASDIFALGAIAYELLTGRKAFGGANILEVLGRIARVDPDRLAEGLPEPLDEVVRVSLAADPDERRLCMAGIVRRLNRPAALLEAAGTY